MLDVDSKRDIVRLRASDVVWQIGAELIHSALLDHILCSTRSNVRKESERQAHSVYSTQQGAGHTSATAHNCSSIDKHDGQAEELSSLQMRSCLVVSRVHARVSLEFAVRLCMMLDREGEHRSNMAEAS